MQKCNLQTAIIRLSIVFFFFWAGARHAPADEMEREAGGELDVNIDFDLRDSSVRTIYVVFSSHWDTEYFDPNDVEHDQIREIIDDLIETAQAHPDFRWNVEATWHLAGWMRANPCPERQEEFFALMRNGQVTVGATEYMLNGLPEEINARLTYHAADLADRFGVAFETANAHDYTGYSWDLIQPLVRSGVKYLFNAYHTQFHPKDGLMRKDEPFWWEGPDGSRLLVWRIPYTSGIYPYGINPNAMHLYNGHEIGEAARALDRSMLTEIALKNELKRIADQGYDKDALMVMLSHDSVWPRNAVWTMEYMKQWNATHETPKLVMAHPEDFFRHMEAKYGDTLPVYHGEYRQWFTGAGVQEVADRRAALDMLEAEKFWSLAEIMGRPHYPLIMLGEQQHDQIYSQGHGGGSFEATQLNEDFTVFRRRQLNDVMVARAYYLRKTGFAMLAPRVYTEGRAIAVHNSLSWNRSGIVELPVDDYLLPEGSGLVDPVTEEPLLCEWAPHEPRLPDGRPEGQVRRRTWMGEIGERKVRIFAPDVPGIGFKAFRVVPDSDHPVAQPAIRTLNTTSTISNAFYDLTISPEGQIVQVRDRQRNRNIVSDRPEVPFAALVCLVNREPGINLFLGVDAMVLGQTTPSAISVSEGPVATIITVSRPGDVLEETEIVLPSRKAEIRITHRINRDLFDEIDLSFWHRMHMNLPLNYAMERFSARIQKGDAVRDHTGNDWSGRLNDIPAFGSLGHGALFTDGDHSFMVASTDLVEIEQGYQIRSAGQPVARIRCNPGGEHPMGHASEVRVVLTTGDGKIGSGEIYRRAWDGVQPLRANRTSHGPLGPFERPTDFIQNDLHRFVGADAENVAVQMLKRARGGSIGQYALRLIETDGRDAQGVRITLPVGTRRAWLADHTEHKISKIPIVDGGVRVNLTPHRLLTLRLEI